MKLKIKTKLLAFVAIIAFAFLAIAGSAAAESISITPTTPYTTDNLRCSAGSDPDSYIYRWFNGGTYVSEGRDVSAASTAKGQTWECKVYLPPTPYTGEIFIGSASVTIQNSPPTSPTTLTTNEPLYVLSTITATASGSSDADPEDTISFEYRFMRGSSELRGWSTTNTFSCIGVCAKGDTISVYARASDGSAVSGQISRNVVIVSSLPIINSVTYLPTNVYVGTDVTVTIDVTNLDGDPLDYTYRFYNEDDAVVLQDWSTDNSYTITLNDVRDLITISGRVCDPEGCDESSVQFTVLNSPPVLQDPGSQIAFVNYPFSLQINASDADNDTLVFSDNTTIFDINNSTGLINFTSSVQVAESVNISVSDSIDTDWVIVFFNVTTLMPMLTNINLTPTIAYTNDDLTCNATLTHPIENSLTAYWTLYKDSAVNLTGSTAVTNGTNTVITTIDSSNTTKGENWTCEVTPNDGFVNGTAQNVSVVVSNSLPVLQDPGSQAAYVNYPFSLQINASDGDNDTLTFYDNTTIFDINSTTGLINFTSGVEVAESVNISVSDGETNSSVVVLFNVTLVVPALQGMDLTPTIAYTNDDLTCSATLTHPLETNLTAYWTWYKDDVVNMSGSSAVTNGTVFSDILNSSNTTKGENWTCELTPNDGFVNGTAQNKSAVINNSIPQLDTAIPAQTWAKNENATINLSGYFSDLDAEDLNYTSTQPTNITVYIDNVTDTVILEPDTNWTGTANITFTAWDSDTANATSNLVSLAVGISTIVNSWINGTLYDGQYTNISGISTSTINISNVTGPTISVADSSVFDSNITNSTILDSNISNSTLVDSIVNLCTILDSVLYGMDCFNQTIDPSDIRYSNITGSENITNSHIWWSNATYSEITDSAIDNSTVNGSVLNSADIDLSTVLDSNLTNSSVDNVTVDNSSVTNSDLLDTVVNNANITDDVIYNGTVLMSNGTVYDADTSGAQNLTELINYAPVAVISSPTGGSFTQGSTISFVSGSYDSNIPGSLNDSLSYLWDFGDGSNSTAENASHSYSSTGSKTITLTVTDSYGSNSSGTVLITITSSGNGNGGDGGTSARTYTIDLSSGSVTKELREDDKVRFKFEGIYHEVKLQDIKTSSVYLRISSLTQYITVNLGETKSVDLNSDNVEDINIKFNSKTSSKASLTFSFIVVEAEEEEEAEEAEAAVSEEEEVAEEEAEEAAEEAEEEEKKEISLWLVYGIATAFLTITSFVVWLALKNGKAKSKK